MGSKHEHHQRIIEVLESMNSDLLQETQCLFGGGTAIALELDEFRLSTDIDFICSSQEGYRKLRGLIGQFSMTGLSPLFDQPLAQIREARADRYGIRSVLEVDGTPIKFEIVREDRISLDASTSLLHNVPTISRVDAYAEKLLANSDRWADKSVFSRDILDLAVMVRYWGEIPEEAKAKARSAYGETVTKDLLSAANLVLQDNFYRRECFEKLRIDQNVQDLLVKTLYGIMTPGHRANSDCDLVNDEADNEDEEPSPGL